MCSTTGDRIARIGVAIDALAAQSGRSAAAPSGAAEDIVGQVASLWAMVAELDPELARRLRRYLA